MKKVAVIILMVSIMGSASAAIKVFYNGETLLKAAQEWVNYQASSKETDIRLVAGYNAYVGGIFDYLSEKQILCAGQDMQRNEVLQSVANKLNTLPLIGGSFCTNFNNCSASKSISA